MKPFLLDTNIIVDTLRKRKERHLLVEQFLDQGHPLASCPITIAEIAETVRSGGKMSQKKQALEEL